KAELLFPEEFAKDGFFAVQDFEKKEQAALQQDVPEGPGAKGLLALPGVIERGGREIGAAATGAIRIAAEAEAGVKPTTLERTREEGLTGLIEAGEEVAVVVTQPDARRGRGGKMCPSPVKSAALEAGVKSLEPLGMGDGAFLDEIRSYRPEFLVVVAYGKILPREVLEVPGLAAVNLHASLLPKYRGAAPINWAIIDGEPETGITTMFMNEGLDEGDILMTEKIVIGQDDTAATLGQKMAGAGGPLLVRTLAGLRDGSIKPVPQEGEPTYARMLGKDEVRKHIAVPNRKQLRRGLARGKGKRGE
ncbi:hypothetical protein LCGC14_3000020, partial [marine sediment metagenome]